MGHSRWSDEEYRSISSLRVKSGKSAFEYNDEVLKTLPPSAHKVHEKLDPKGLKFRESRDSDAHPESLPIVVAFDVTGSMQNVPRLLQEKLGGLMQLLIKQGYVEHPQILFAAFGDATCDRGPLQIGQFESGLEMEGDLGRFWLEGGGGGQQTESYELLLYTIARHTVTDSWEKRGKKGYLFLIGDEMPYPKVNEKLAQSLIGDGLESSISVEDLLKEVREKWNVVFILPSGTYYYEDSGVEKKWKELLGPQNVIKLDDVANVSETIGLSVGLGEGTVDLDDAKTHLKDAGATKKVVDSVTKALAHVAKTTAVTKATATGEIVRSSAPTTAKRI